MQHPNTTLAPYAPLFRASERPSPQQARLSELLAQPGSWSREARIVQELASKRGACLDVEWLIYSDVRDLVSLQHALRQLDPSSTVSRLPRELRLYLHP